MVIERGYLTYTDDNDNNVYIRATLNTATNNGQTLSALPAVATPWPYGGRNCRHWCGVTSDGLKRARMTICDPDVFRDAIGLKFFSNSKGDTFGVISQIGERKDSRFG